MSLFRLSKIGRNERAAYQVMNHAFANARNRDLLRPSDKQISRKHRSSEMFAVNHYSRKRVWLSPSRPTKRPLLPPAVACGGRHSLSLNVSRIITEPKRADHIRARLGWPTAVLEMCYRRKETSGDSVAAGNEVAG